MAMCLRYSYDTFISLNILMTLRTSQLSHCEPYIMTVYEVHAYDTYCIVNTLITV